MRLALPPADCRADHSTVQVLGALDQFGRTSAWQPAAWPHQLQWPSARCRPDVSCARSAGGSASSERPQIACQRCQRACGGRSHHPKPCQPLSRAPLDTCSLAAAPPPSHGMLRVASCRVHLSCALDHCQLPGSCLLSWDNCLAAGRIYEAAA